MTLQGRNQAKILDKSKPMVEIGLKIYENLDKAAALSVLPLITPLQFLFQKDNLRGPTTTTLQQNKRKCMDS